MFAEIHIELFTVPSLDRPSHMMTDLHFWSKQFDLLSYGNTQALVKVIRNQIKYLGTMKQEGLHGKDEETFFQKVCSLNRLLNNHEEVLAINKDFFVEISQRLKRYTDDSMNCTQTVDEFYRKAQKELDKQTRVVQEQAKKYQNLFTRMEKTEIGARLADRQRVLDKANKKLEDLTDKVEAKYAKYCNELGKWKFLLSHVQNLSYDYEREYVDREAARAKTVLACLQELADEIAAAKAVKRHVRGPLFTGIFESRFVREKLIRAETTQIPNVMVLETHRLHKQRRTDFTVVKPYADGIASWKQESPLYSWLTSFVDDQFMK